MTENNELQQKIAQLFEFHNPFDILSEIIVPLKSDPVMVCIADQIEDAVLWNPRTMQAAASQED